jgi:hypothetical protein
VQFRAPQVQTSHGENQKQDGHRCGLRFGCVLVRFAANLPLGVFFKSFPFFAFFN